MALANPRLMGGGWPGTGGKRQKIAGSGALAGRNGWQAILFMLDHTDRSAA